MALTPDVPGRGAWTRTGGLLPIRPTSTNRAGFYRAPIGAEPMTGSGWPSGRDRTHTGLVVHEAVKSLQRLLGVTPDGYLGARTGAAIVAAQARNGLTPDGIAGPDTLRALLVPLVAASAAEHRVPVDVLGGICVHESRLDLAAVGVSGWDHGLAQINLGAHTSVTVAQAIDPHLALDRRGGIADGPDRLIEHAFEDRRASDATIDDEISGIAGTQPRERLEHEPLIGAQSGAGARDRIERGAELRE